MSSRVAALLLGVAAGCASYDERIAAIHRDVYEGRLDQAIERLQDEIDDGGADSRLLQLELSCVLQAVGRHEQAAWTLAEVDQELETLDYTSDAIADVAAFTFAPGRTAYRASPPERVMLETQAMIAFLAAGDLENASVAARRLGLWLTQQDVPSDELFANSLAWSLAGLVFELSGDLEEMRDAYRAAGPTALAPPPLGASPRQAGGVIAVVAQMGKVPVRKESIYLLFVGGRLHRLNLPTLVSRRSLFHTATVSVDGAAPVELPLVFDLGEHARRRYVQELPRLLAAAAVQVVPRALAAESVRRAAEKELDDDETTSDDKAVEAFSRSLADLAEFLFAEIGGVDTRCWSLLPETLRASRLDVPAGRHEVRVELVGAQPQILSFEVDMPPGGFALLHVPSAPHEGYESLPHVRARDMHDTTAAEEALHVLEQVLLLREIYSH